MELALCKVSDFWQTHGMRIESANRPGTFKYDLVQKMSELHADIAAVTDKPIFREPCNPVGLHPVRRKIQDIVSLQNRHIMQFEFCLDEFNRYLTTLRLLDVLLQPRRW